MRIEETLYTKKIIIESEDPYGFALELMNFMSRTGKVIERENKYETDGPARRITLKFVLEEQMDNVSSSVAEFSVSGGTNGVNYLEIRITGNFYANIETAGCFTEAFVDYYTKHAMPRNLRQADRKFKDVDKSAMEFIDQARKIKKHVRH